VALVLEVRKALPGFTLDVAWEAGDEVVTLFGPSGAGKTLTLQCLAGLVRPDSGRIVVNGTVFFDGALGVDVPTQRRRLGYVFQGYALFPHLNVRDNVAYGLAHLSATARRERTREVLERLGLADLASRRPRELSGGQQQRVALGRALAPDPALVLLDEPLSALDLPLRQALRDDLRAVLAEWRTAAVLVTHDFTEAYRLGDRIVVYEAGRVIQTAPRAELLWQPASERVAGIVGIRNVLHGTVLKATPDRIQFHWRGQLLEAVNSPTRSYLPAPDSPLAFFIRPEYVRLIRKDRGSPDPGHHMNLMQGRVVSEADFGTTWTLYVRLDAPGAPAQGEYDLEIEVPRLVYEILDIAHDRQWQLSIHRGSIHVLPSSPLSPLGRGPQFELRRPRRGEGWEGEGEQ
jgi:molybdate transport system ATP-binding protein